MSVTIEEFHSFDLKSSFLKKDFPNFDVQNIGKRPIAVGLWRNGALDSFGIFCNPASSERQILSPTEFLVYHQERVGEKFRKENQEALFQNLLQRSQTYSVLVGEDVWNNPNWGFYVYRITAPGSDCYYYGRHTLRKVDPEVDLTESECLTDGYYGSGGEKFKTWRAAQPTLNKEILKICATRSESILLESEIIGDLHLKDPNCLNSVPGGHWSGFGAFQPQFELGNCVIHGETSFAGGKTCHKCSTSSAVSVQYCEIHGESPFKKSGCLRCLAQKSLKEIRCGTHGLTTHQNGVCSKCRASEAIEMRNCEIHGLTKHLGFTCCRCSSEKSISLFECPTHGLVKHQGLKKKSCLSCAAQKSVNIRNCSVHGEVTHQGKSCSRCAIEKIFRVQNCETHGKTKFRGNSCIMCANSKVTTIRFCSIHGKVKHQGERCCSCFNGALIAIRSCPTHGETKHRGKTCYKCSSERRKDRNAK